MSQSSGDSNLSLETFRSLAHRLILPDDFHRHIALVPRIARTIHGRTAAFAEDVLDQQTAIAQHGIGADHLERGGATW